MPNTFPNRFSLQELPTQRFGREVGTHEVAPSHQHGRQRWPFPVAAGYGGLQTPSAHAGRYTPHGSHASSFVT
ncbi:MAG: hypothetical protein ABIP46_11285 [Polaromonas sp.]